MHRARNATGRVLWDFISGYLMHLHLGVASLSVSAIFCEADYLIVFHSRGGSFLIATQNLRRLELRNFGGEITENGGSMVIQILNLARIEFLAIRGQSHSKLPIRGSVPGVTNSRRRTFTSFFRYMWGRCVPKGQFRRLQSANGKNGFAGHPAMEHCAQIRI
jgi:hypothetical protein